MDYELYELLPRGILSYGATNSANHMYPANEHFKARADKAIMSSG